MVTYYIKCVTTSWQTVCTTHPVPVPNPINGSKGWVTQQESVPFHYKILHRNRKIYDSPINFEELRHREDPAGFADPNLKQVFLHDLLPWGIWHRTSSNQTEKKLTTVNFYLKKNQVWLRIVMRILHTICEIYYNTRRKRKISGVEGRIWTLLLSYFFSPSTS